MSRWAYDTDSPPPQAWEVVHAAAAILRADAVITGPLGLGSASSVYADEGPATPPLNERYIVVREYQQAGGVPVDPSGLLTARLHVKVVCPLEMTNWRQWHAAMHARIARALIGAKPEMTRAAAGWTGFRQYTEPSRPETYDERRRESFCLYDITLQSPNA